MADPDRQLAIDRLTQLNPFLIMGLCQICKCDRASLPWPSFKHHLQICQVVCLQLFQNYIQYKYSSPINENVLAHNSYKDINEVLSEMKDVSRRETINEVSIESHGVRYDLS